MLKKLKELYRVDTVPKPLHYPFILISYLLGSFLYYINHFLVHHLSKIEVIGEDPRKSKEKYIFCTWHGNVFAFFTAFCRMPPLAVLNHPLWYMKPIHFLIQKVGVKKIFLGSTGHGGKNAAIQLAEELKRGNYSTFVNPDGPNGPAFKLNKGIFHLAHQSGLPIVPISIKASNAIRLSGWDQKLIPLPFGKICVEAAPKIYIKDTNFEKYFQEIKEGLNGESQKL